METNEAKSEQMERSDHVGIDIEIEGEIVPTANEKVDSSDDDSAYTENPATFLRTQLGNMQRLSEDFSICRVPERLRYSNERAYRPRIVSIGPLHHGRKELKEMEGYKINCLQDFLGRTEVSLEDFVEIIKEKEERLRNCYAETIGLSSHDFVKMTLVDAVFVIEVLLGNYFVGNDNFPVSMDRVYRKPWFIADICCDMLALENQLPFFIIKKLFKKANVTIFSDSSSEDSAKDTRLSMRKLTHNFSCKYWDFTDNVENLDKGTYSKVAHFVDFLRLRTLPSGSKEERRSSYRTISSVTELHQAGVKFVLGSSDNIFDINFKDGIMEIPKIEINTETELLLRNLLAFERCFCVDLYINDYALLMHSLLSTPSDVNLLIKKGIIVNWLKGSEGVSTLFHSLVQLTVFDQGIGYYFSSLVDDVNRYCEPSRHKWMANLKQDYFNTPWTTISVVAAIVLLVLTFIQTVCSILQVK